jgi:hypothetical protein
VALAAACVSVPAAQATDYVAFQANTGSLWKWDSSFGGHDLHLGMKKGTSPSITVTRRGLPKINIAFQANTGHLWEWTNFSGGHDLHLGMMTGTSPSLAAPIFTEPEIAFQANTGHLWIFRHRRGTDTGLGMMPHSSPSYMHGLFGPMLAFQANTGHLWVSRFGSAYHDTGMGMRPGTSPSIAEQGGAAFQANTGYLWMYLGPHGTKDLGQLMMAGTSPSYIGVIAFQLYNGHLGVEDPLNGIITHTELRMMAGTSPSVEHATVAFQGSNGHLWIYHWGGGARDTGLGMMPGTSPSIAVNTVT